MSVAPPVAHRSKAAPSAAPQTRGGWGVHGKAHDRTRLRLLGALRGGGELVWPAGAVQVTYELDLFGRGPLRVANGNLEGDFSSLIPNDPDEFARPMGLRLRLDDGGELEVTLIALDADGCEFDAQGAAVGAYMAARLDDGAPISDQQSARWI
ncbi:hypothetical protein [Phenylobacterium montanum]|uniref:Uncharacterized protein n=1 Tax=Phenylobacterium montanum TaxID=2823693 RepID=A0A975G307_9CAUL|nr:hypothetical protein [Caulobacter sp. S6]QUD89766.1 hypothetical protein KCG34_07815 [Caulobacter sp. S6]